MRRGIFTLILAGLLLPPTLSAQGVLVVSQNKCHLGRVGDIRAFADSAWTPLAREMVDDGKLLAAGTAYHMWGDEWNVVFWYTASDVSSFLTAFGEMISQTTEQWPEGLQLIFDSCSEHKDSFYRMGASTQSLEMPEEGS